MELPGADAVMSRVRGFYCLMETVAREPMLLVIAKRIELSLRLHLRLP